MRVRVISIGERMPSWVAEGVAEYVKRLSRELKIELVEIPQGKHQETALLAAIPRNAHVVALDGRGKAWSSEQLSQELSRWRMQGRDLAFLIGGPDGHTEEVLARSDQRWSLGPLTLPHMIVRLLVAEQLYRAASLLAGHPYHRG